MRAREHFNDFELHGVGILKFVDVNVTEFFGIIFQNFGVIFKKAQRINQQIVKIERVALFKIVVIPYKNLGKFFYFGDKRIVVFIFRRGKIAAFRVGNYVFSLF